MTSTGLSRFDVLDICAVMLQRCGLTADELARHMARPELPSAAPAPEVKAPPAVAPAPEPKPVKTPKPPKPPKPTIVGDFVQAIAKPTGETIIPAHVVIQRAAPAVDTRLQVKTGDLLTGGFSTSRPGINPLTGLAWGGRGVNDCDEMLADWTEALCAKAVVDDHLSAVLLVVRELHTALPEGRPMNPDYSVMLAQALAAADFCAVHGILIEASCQKAAG